MKLKSNEVILCRLQDQIPMLKEEQEGKLVGGFSGISGVTSAKKDVNSVNCSATTCTNTNLNTNGLLFCSCNCSCPVSTTAAPTKSPTTSPSTAPKTSGMLSIGFF